MPPLVQVADVACGYRGREVLKGVSLALGEGELVVLLGPNGAGKSTLVKAIAGQLAPEQGWVRVSDRDPAADPQARAMTGIVPQHIALFEKLTAHENLVAIGRLMGVGRREAPVRASALLDKVGLADRSDDRVHALSGGMRRRVNIAAALMHQPRVLILDEPTVGVDVVARDELAALLRSLRADGLAVMLTTHDLEEAASLADRVAIIIDGRIVADGTTAEIVQERFAERRSVTLTFAAAAGASGGGTLAAAMRAAGFRVLPDGRSWQGVVDSGDTGVEQLVTLALRATRSVEEVRVRRPGLDAVLKHHIVSAHGAG